MRNFALLAAGAASFALSGCETVAEATQPTHHATLQGTAEVPGPGDPDGTGQAEVSIVDASDNLCFELSNIQNVSGITAAHIHRGAPTEAGPPVVPLDTPTDGHSKGCVRVDGALADEIENNPERFYVNVHSTEFPNGAVRGQLTRSE